MVRISTSTRPAGPRNAPVRGVHRTAIVLGMAAAAWFVVAMVIAFSGGVEGTYLMAVVALFSIIFFGLTLGIASRNAREPRWSEREPSFGEFMRDRVELHTGRLPGRAVLIQLLTLPVTLALGATIIGLIFAWSF